MYSVEGLLPQEAFDELLKFLFYKECIEMQPDEYNHYLFASPSKIREFFSKQLDFHASWAMSLWPEKKFRLSDITLLELENLFKDVCLKELPLDLRSTALRTFLTSNIRKSLGIFTTPEDVVRTMIEILGPKSTDIILDPACGTGTFLMETIRFLTNQQSSNESLSVLGIDKNPRMLFLADLNIGHNSNVLFKKECADSLCMLGNPKQSLLGLSNNSVDIILTNPPFGTTVTQNTGILDLFKTGEIIMNQEKKGVPSEILFTELCLRLLKPGGSLGIVLPRSVLTNEQFRVQRHLIDQLGYLTSIIDLPPETFTLSGTQTTTVAAFFKKHSQSHKSNQITVRVCRVTNVGFDATGRHKKGNQLPLVAKRLAEVELAGKPNVISYSNIRQNESLQCAARLLFKRNGIRVGKKLKEFLDLANTGRTPSRNAYTDEGMFILKVGNLTGRGIDWEPRERNFIPFRESLKRMRSHSLTLREGDILLTSSAHTVHYIAKKVDIIAGIPKNYGELTFVGELMRIRPKPGIDPFVLLASLRHPMVRDDLQASVRGQTAHLNPKDLLEITIPYDLLNPDKDLVEAAKLFKQEATLASELNRVATEASKLLQSTLSSMI